MRLFGLIGRNISYSFSKSYFKEKFIKENIVDASYNVFDLSAINDIKSILDNKKLVGFNVTIPYKEEIMKYLDDITDEAEKIGAVNTVLIKNGKKIGYNTDYYGFYYSIKPLLEIKHKKALVLGSGGAAKAVIYALNQIGIEYKIISRSQLNNNFTYEDINENLINNYQIIINASPVGTFPNVENYPSLPYQYINSNHLLYDLIYNPPLTKFLEIGHLKGAKIKNGNEMLVIQAEKSWEIWNK